MDPKSREYLDKILQRSPVELNEDERSFLKARRSYLTKAQLEEYDSIINQTSEVEPVKQNAKPHKAN